MNLRFWFRALCAGWALSAVSCAASHGLQQQESAVSSQRIAGQQEVVATAQHACGEFVRQETIVRQEPVASQRVVLALPLAAVQDLPEGLGFSARRGPLTVGVRPCSDSLVIEARSDSLPRTVVRVERTELRQQRDSSASRLAAGRMEQRSDTLRHALRTENIRSPSRFRCGGRWFVAGAAVASLVFLWLRFQLK